MYESFFGLCRRPFSATPDPNSFVAVESVRQVLDELRVCVAGGQGIGILTAPPGTGKTLLCERLAAELGIAFQTVLMTNSNFPTKRSLLQSILYELGRPYNRMDEQELRLELATTVRSVRPTKRGVVLVFDEAHLLSERLLEEIRAITNLTEDGEPLVRVVLSGNLSLEETLAGPALEALNQRVRCHVSLPMLTRQESVEYITQRLEWAGGKLEDMLTPEAVDLIAHASDGLPRCLNQLCDHSLLLAYVSERKPVTADIVREALDDLKPLPLHWNEPLPPMPADNGPEDAEAVDNQPVSEVNEPADRMGAAGEHTADEDVDVPHEAFEFGNEESVAVIEFGPPDETASYPAETTSMKEFAEPDAIANADLDFPETVPAPASFTYPPDERGVPIAGDVLSTFEPPSPTFNQEIHMTTFDAGQFEEEVVVDRYAALDARVQQAHGPGIVWNIVAPEIESPPAKSAPASNTAITDESPEPMDDRGSEIRPNLEDAIPPEGTAGNRSDSAFARENLAETDASAEHRQESPSEECTDSGIESIALGEADAETRLDAIHTLLEEAIGSRQSTTPADDSQRTDAAPHSVEDASEISLQLIATTLGDATLEHMIGREVLDVSLDLEQARLDRLYQVETVNIDTILRAVQPLGENPDHGYEPPFGETYDVVEPEPPESYREVGSIAATETRWEDGARPPRRPGLRLEPARRPDPPHRPYAHLFSKLRRRQEESESAY